MVTSTQNLEMTPNDVDAKIQAFRTKMDSSPDPVIQSVNNALSFSVSDITQLLEAHPDCQFVRVFNGLDENNGTITHVAFLLPVDNNLEVVSDPQPKSSCCPCKHYLTQPAQ